MPQGKYRLTASLYPESRRTGYAIAHYNLAVGDWQKCRKAIEKATLEALAANCELLTQSTSATDFQNSRGELLQLLIERTTEPEFENFNKRLLPCY